MDRNIDGNTATGFDGEDENLIVDFADSTFNKVFLFFYIPDETDILSTRVPTRFMTGWSASLAELAERIYWFGANSAPSHLWPMYSAEDSLSPGDSNIYLGDWLQGSAGTFWAGQQHYITECQNIFRGQIDDYIVTTTNDNPGWQQSFSIIGDAFFKYGLNVLDSLRNQDRFPNFYTRPACNQNRIAHSTHELKGYENEKPQSDNSSCIMLTSNEDFLQFRLGQEKQSVISSADGKTFYLQEMDFNTFSSGIYFVNSSSSHQIIVIVK
jgi:hypothetical protein